jgi:hypothetical protein
VVVATARGFAPRTRRITFDEEQEIELELTPLERPDPKSPPVVPTVPRGSQTAKPHPTSTGSKPIRPLDEHNPFGDTN